MTGRIFYPSALLRKPQDRYAVMRCWAAAIILNLASASSCLATDWQSTISKEPPGAFPALRPLRASYRFGWSGFTAATGELHFMGQAGNRLQLEGAVHTTGLVRALWRLDGDLSALSDAETLHPIEMKQTEIYRRKKMVTQVAFNAGGATRTRTEGPGLGTTTTKEFHFPNLFDLHSAALYLRSEPLKEHSTYRVAVYPATSAYLATLTVLSREKISVHAGSYNAIKLDLKLSKIGKQMELEPHRKFKRASIWISDDANRLPLRIEAQIFVGTVFAELQSVEFDKPAP
ncbi:MAG: DUF3108 domain-containing protein [Verrucomicrobiota bacterium]